MKIVKKIECNQMVHDEHKTCINKIIGMLSSKLQAIIIIHFPIKLNKKRLRMYFLENT